ncbi:MAG: hypothetical protein J6S12_01905, partial [Alphaproteobacteria bacterium]|nr:hypothetical protein [Alphaproteobacteria bacterium]
MLKRILSAFLLCLCVSPVWADIVKSVRQGVSYCKSNAGIGGWCTDFYLWFDSGNLMISADDYADSLSSRRDDRVDSFVACDVKYCPCEGNNAFNVTEEKGCFYYEEDHRSDQNLWKRASFFEGKVNECTLSSRTNVSLKNGTLTIYVDKTKYTDQQENAKRILMMVGGHEVETPYYHSTNVNDLIGCYTYKCNDGYIVYNGKCTERKSLTPGQICEAGRKTK